MKKLAENLTAYVLNGKGIGMKPVFFFALICSLYVMFMGYNAFKIALPYVQNVIYEIAPIAIEDGVVVAPKDTKKVFPLWENDESAFMFVLDTQKDTLDTFEYPLATYLTRSNVYSVTPWMMRRFALKGSFKLEHEDYMSRMNARLLPLALALGAYVFVAGFCLTMVYVLFYAWMMKFAELIAKRKMAFRARMRLNAVLFVAVYALARGFVFLNLPFDGIAFFLLMLILQILSLKSLSKENPTEAPA